MPWLKAKLRGQLVFARANADGTLAPAPDGRVEIRYKPNDGRAYHARANNLEIASPEVLPEETCGAAEAPKPRAEGDGASASGPAKKSNAKKSASASKVSKHENGPLPADAYVAYADGACTGNPGPCGLGIVLIAPGGARREGYEFLGHGTNNIAELTAVLRAVEATPKDAASLYIHTDSQYSIGVLTKGWKAKANQDLIADVKRALATFGKATLRYVPGHSGVELNEVADQLARTAVSSRGSKKL